MDRYALIFAFAAALSAGVTHAAEEAAKPPVDTAALEKQLQEARARLDEAAREVATLSTQLGAPVINRVLQARPFPGVPPRSMIGVQLDIPTEKGGAHIIAVSPGGPAAEAGVLAGDEIIQVDEKKIDGIASGNVFTAYVGAAAPDSSLKLRVLRDGKRKDLTVTTRPAPPFFGMNTLYLSPGATAVGEVSNSPGAVHFRSAEGIAGLELVTLTPKLGEYFGTTKGVLVVRAPGSKSLKLEEGDVILSIGGREPMNGAHATRILYSYQPREKFELKIFRQRKNVTLESTLPDTPFRGFQGRMMPLDSTPESFPPPPPPPPTGDLQPLPRPEQSEDLREYTYRKLAGDST